MGTVLLWLLAAYVAFIVGVGLLVGVLAAFGILVGFLMACAAVVLLLAFFFER